MRFERESKNQIPHHEPCTQPNRSPEHSLRRTPTLGRSLELAVTTPDIRLSRVDVTDELRDVLFLCREVRDESFLQRGDFNK
jgi:hypothetical protein